MAGDPRAQLREAALDVPAGRNLQVRGLQLAFDVAAYIISPLDPAAHVVSSWGRLMAQIAIPLLFVAISGVAGPEARDSTR